MPEIEGKTKKNLPTMNGPRRASLPWIFSENITISKWQKLSGGPQVHARNQIHTGSGDREQRKENNSKDEKSMHGKPELGVEYLKMQR
jgi:hypothetical protein